MEHIGTLIDADALDQSPLDDDGRPPSARTESSMSVASSGSAATGSSSTRRRDSFASVSSDVPSFRFGRSSSKRDSFGRDPPTVADVALYKDGIKKQDEGHANAGRLNIVEPSGDEVVEEYEVARRVKSRPSVVLGPGLSPIGEGRGGTSPGSATPRSTPRKTPVRVVDSEFLVASGLPTPPLFQRVDGTPDPDGRSDGSDGQASDHAPLKKNTSNETPDSIQPEVNPRRKSEEEVVLSRRQRRVSIGSIVFLVMLVVAAAAIAVVFATRDGRGGETSTKSVVVKEDGPPGARPFTASRFPSSSPVWVPSGGIFDEPAADAPGGIFDAGSAGDPVRRDETCFNKSLPFSLEDN